MRFKQQSSVGNIPYYSRYDLEHIAQSQLREAYPQNLEIPTPLNVDEFIRDYQGLLLKYHYLGLPAFPVLGIAVMSESAEIVACKPDMTPTVLEEHYGTILITTDLAGQRNLPRCRYTKAHESAHWTLHKEVGVTTCNRVERYQRKNKTPEDWMEWQADGLAAALLMPQEVFTDYVRMAIRKTGSRFSYLTQGDPSDRRRFYEIIDDVASTFRVSHRAAQIRMIHLGLIKTAPAF